MTIGQGTWHVPLYWELLDNRSGNSNAAQRIAVLQVCLDLLGRERIGLVLGDREFGGHVWLKWLQDNKLNFVMRLPRHHHLTLPDGQVRAVADLGLTVGHVRRWPRAQVAGVWGMVWVKALADGDFLFLFDNVGACLTGTSSTPGAGRLSSAFKTSRAGVSTWKTPAYAASTSCESSSPSSA